MSASNGISANYLIVSELLRIEGGEIYEVPFYQREYTWEKDQCEKLLDDIQESEKGYFLGSIICIDKSPESNSNKRLELVDGQQRMTSISLLLAAIYSRLKKHEKDSKKDLTDAISDTRRKLILKEDPDKTHLILQEQSNNQQNFMAVLSEIGILTFHDIPRPETGYIFKAYRYFENQIGLIYEKQDGGIGAILKLLDKVTYTSMVRIIVGSHSDAYKLFESLNHSGKSLTATDLIKSKLLSRLNDIEPGKVKLYSKDWNQVIEYLGTDYAIQDRFFRQYYNAFKSQMKNEPSVPIATRSNLIDIYETIIESDAKEFLSNIIEASRWYSLIIGRFQDGKYASLAKYLKDLDRIQGAPSFLLLLYLLIEKNRLGLDEKDYPRLIQIIQSLVKFSVRRNLTDVPPTRDLNRLFMEIVERISKLSGDDVVETITSKIAENSSSDKEFCRQLSGPIYSKNSSVVRFILCSIEENAMNRKKIVGDLWAKKNKQYVWTIEHIFPQGENIPEHWVKMMANGDKAKAIELQSQYVDCIGNLTLSNFNSEQGNKSIAKKRDLKDKNQEWYVGYRNGLRLNEDLAECTEWTVDHIEKRTEKLAKEAHNLFRLEEKA
ncbi:MAG: DUF262 domain-containing HNH endonuclease family protein [Methanothrix sp.]